MQKLTAFIAKSFSPDDESRIRPILEFLRTFEKIGFFCQTAEVAEVESVSAKVWRIIEDCDVFIGIFTRRHPIYMPSQFSFVHPFRIQQIKGWSAPPWILQESGFALAKKKHLILLREEEVEVFGLQGDLEYVSFSPNNPTAIFSRLSEMIHSLVANAAGTYVEVSVKAKAPEQPSADEPASIEKVNQASITSTEISSSEEVNHVSVTASEKHSLIPHFQRLIEAAANRDLDSITLAYEAGQEEIAKGEVEVDRLAWDAIYFQHEFEAGSTAGLDKLRKLHREHPDRLEPIRRIADLLFDSSEYEEAAELYCEAAKLSPTESTRTFSLIKAAKAYDAMKYTQRALDIAWKAFRESSGEKHRDACTLLYDLLAKQKERIFAFGIAEAALHDNPQYPIRFKLGLDYHAEEWNELFLFHFNHIYESDSKNSGALHNLALALSECGLPVSSVSQYKKAFELGETLSAANLAYKYLDVGMADNAKEVLESAMKYSVHDARVDACVADITERQKTEAARTDDLLDVAQNIRRFLIAVGDGLQREPGTIDGLWAMPFG